MSSPTQEFPPPHVISVSCNHCGAPLQLREDTRFASCTYCGANLEVVQSGGATYTRVIDRIDQRTQRIEKRVDELNYREQLDQLDREWMLRRDQYMVRGRRGGASIPSAGMAIMMTLFAVVFGIF